MRFIVCRPLRLSSTFHLIPRGVRYYETNDHKEDLMKRMEELEKKCNHQKTQIETVGALGCLYLAGKTKHQ